MAQNNDREKGKGRGGGSERERERERENNTGIHVERIVTFDINSKEDTVSKSTH